MKAAREKPDQRQIWKEFKEGSERAFSFLYDEYFDALFNYGMHVDPHRELVEDCIQDLFIEIWNNKQNLGDVVAVKFYLFKSLRRKIVTVLESNRRHQHQAQQAVHDNIVLSPELNLLADQLAQERQDKLTKALATLSQQQREALLLKFYEGMSYPEVADMMGINVKNTHKIVARGLEALRKNLFLSSALLLTSLLLGVKLLELFLF